MGAMPIGNRWAYGRRRQQPGLRRQYGFRGKQYGRCKRKYGFPDWSLKKKLNILKWNGRRAWWQARGRRIPQWSFARTQPPEGSNSSDSFQMRSSLRGKSRACPWWGLGGEWGLGRAIGEGGKWGAKKARCDFCCQNKFYTNNVHFLSFHKNKSTYHLISE